MSQKPQITANEFQEKKIKMRFQIDGQQAVRKYRNFLVMKFSALSL